MIYFPPYSPPFRTPYYWRNEQSGELAAAVAAYVDWRCNGASRPSEVQAQMLIAYLRHWINAPCWTACEKLHLLRLRAQDMTTLDQAPEWIRQALAIGIDPF